MDATSRSWPPRIRLGAALVLAALMWAMVAFGWDRGPDAMIDFGRELYVPWRLIEGEVLHGDIAWFNGPLAPWVLQAWMQLFGVSLDVLQWLNVLVIGTTLVLLVLLVRPLSDDLTAFVGGVVFLSVFAVAQQGDVGNFLFLTPYSHGITFGFVAGLAALYGLVRTVRGSGWIAPCLAGVAAGAVFLTKAEVFLATASACAAMLGAYVLSTPPSDPGHGSARRANRARVCALFALGFAVPLTAAYLRFRSEIGSERAFHALLGTWPYAFEPRIGELKFYRIMRGSDAPVWHIKHMLSQTVLTAMFVHAIFKGADSVARRVRDARLAALLSFGGGALATLVVLFAVLIKWLLIPLPIVLTVLGYVSLRAWWRERGGTQAPQAIHRLGLVVFAGTLLLKVALLPLVRQYGFVLSLPGALLLVAVILHWIPRLALRRGWIGRASLPAVRAAGTGVILVFALANLNSTLTRFAFKTTEFGTGADRMWVLEERGEIMNEVARDLSERLPKDAQLLVLPEGIVLNYLLRLRAPSRVINFMPPELIFFAPELIVEELEANPPDAIAMLHRPTDIYGYPFFGQGYGEVLLEWVQENYESVRQIGSVAPFEDGPLGPGPFGAAILLPREGAPRIQSGEEAESVGMIAPSVRD